MAQLKSTNITGNLAVTGNILASKIIKLGGTNDDILMGDGSTTSKQALIDSLEAAMEGDTNTWREIKVNGTSILGTGIDTGSLNLKAGTNVSISNSGGTVTISSSYKDEGATSVEVTGTGNAVTAASYDATTRKITLTKGSTFLTSHQSLAAYVKGPASATDNAVARFDSTTGKVIQNSRTTIDDTGNLKINNSDGGDIGLTLGRGSNADWRLLGSNGNFYIQGNYTTSKQTSFYSVLTLAYNSGNATVKGSVTANGFKHSNSTTGTNDYVLLAGGGTKSLSDFGTGSGNVSGSGLTANCIVLGNGSSSIKTSSKTIATSVGTDDTTVPTSKAVKDYVTGLGYITGSYLPLAGGTMTGAIVLPENKMSLKLRTHTTYETGIVYGTTGNEALTIAMQNPVSAFQIVYGTKPSAYGGSTWQSVTPLFQTKDGKVIINRKITATADTTNLKLLDVNGEIGATKLTTSEVITSKVTFPQESGPSIYSGSNMEGVYIEGGVETDQVRIKKIWAPTSSNGTTFGTGTNGQVLKSNGTSVYWASDSNNYAYVRQYQSGRNAAGATSCYPLLARYNLTNKNGTYDTAYSRFHTDAYLNTISGEISTRGYNILDSSGEAKGVIALSDNNSITISCEGNSVRVAGSVIAYSGFHIQAPGGARQNVATEDWVRQYVAENSGGSSGPVVPDGDSVLSIGFYKNHRFNYDSDWSQEWMTYPREVTGLVEEEYYLEPYSQYSQNNQWVIYADCVDDSISVSTSWGMSYERIGSYGYRLLFQGEEGHLIPNPQWIQFAVGGAVYKMTIYFEDDYYMD